MLNASGLSQTEPLIQEIFRNPDPVSQFVSIQTMPGIPGMYTATGHNVYWLSESQSNTVWKIHDLRSNIHKLMSFPSIPDTLFILTEDGLFKFNIKTKKSEKVFGGRGIRQRDVFSFTILPGDPLHWFVGTSSGIFESDNGGKSWFYIDSLHRQPVQQMTFQDEHLFAAGLRKIFSTNDLTAFTPVYELRTNEENTGDEIPEESGGEAIQPDFTALVAGDYQQKTFLWASSGKNIFQSTDLGHHWQSLSSAGFSGNYIRCLLYDSESKIYAGTDRGVFVYDLQNSSWKVFDAAGILEVTALTLHHSADGSRVLTLMSPETISQAFVVPEPLLAPDLHIDAHKQFLLDRLLTLEPGIRDVHRQVTRHNHLGNGKINRWHTASRLRALLPSFSFSKDLSQSTSVDLDRGGTSDPDRYILGPDQSSRGWDASVSWDFGDFIWSSAQTSIDSRDKLNAEFRQDLLAQATQLYFERRRYQKQWLSAPTEEPTERTERLSRIDEMTALIDALTGGWFAENLARIYEKNPDLLSIWD